MDNELIQGPRPPRSRYLRREGDEPLKGYRLVAPLGIGGFGEVWKCRAPGGILKAMKVVPLSAGEIEEHAQSPAQLERQAMERIKEIRHPFLIAVDRIDQTADELIVVMELAESSLSQDFDACRRLGLPGVPAEQLLRQLREAAEVLDVMNFQFRLQHYDIKPANLLISSGHVKLADFGLVNSVESPEPGQPSPFRCFTPRYAAPELLQGQVSRVCDQYSLAVVYQEMLTGQLPYDGNSLLKRLLKKPNLDPLPPCDQPVVERALSSKPEERFRSCTEFIDALLTAEGGARLISMVGGPVAGMQRTPVAPLGPGPDTVVEAPSQWNWVGAIAVCEPTVARPSDPDTQNLAARGTADVTEPDLDLDADAGPPPDPNAGIIYPPTIHVSDMRWKPDPDGDLAPPVSDFIASMCRAATGEFIGASSSHSSPLLELPGQIMEHSFHMPSASTLALRQRFEKIVADCRGEVIARSDRSIAFAVEEAVPFWKLFNSKQRILKVSVRVDGGGDLSRVHVRIEPLDKGGQELDPGLVNLRPLLLRNVRSVLQVAPERRQNERYGCSFQMRLYPVLPDWKFGDAIHATAINISSGGIGFSTLEDISTDRVYLRPAIPASLSEYAILTDIVRRRRLPDGTYAFGAMLGKI